MKIECDICQTVFLIDDNLISDKGIKAQCPRCGDQKVVRRPPPEEIPLGQPSSSPYDQSTSLSAPLFTADAPAFSPHQFTADAPSYSASPPLSGSFSGTGGATAFSQPDYNAGNMDFVGSADDLAADLTCFKCGKPIPESTDSVLPVCDECRGETANYSPMDAGLDDLPTTGDFGGPPTSAPAADKYDFGMPPPEAAYSPFGSNGSSTSLNASPDYIPSSTLPPMEDNAPSFSPIDREDRDFAQSLGGSDMPPLDELPLPSDDTGRLDPSWIKVRRVSDGQVVGPISLAEVRSLYVHGKLSMDDEYAGQDGVWYPIHQVPELMVILRRTPQLGSGQASAPDSGGGQRFLLWLVAILLLGGGGGTAWLIWSNSHKLKGKKAGPSGPAKTIQPNQLMGEKLARWKRQFPDVPKGAKASKRLTQQGLALMIKDDKNSYNQAGDLFAKALLAQRSNRKALAGYCLATIWSPDRKQSSARRIGECSALLKQAHKSAPPLTQAVYALYLTRRGARATARKTIRKARKRADKMGFIHLIYAALLHSQRRSPKRVQRALKVAIKSNAKLARAHWLVAKSALASQHYSRAVESLKHLAKSSHPKGLFLYADYHIKVGEFTEAAEKLQKLLEAHPSHLRGWLKLGILQYQLLGKRKAALKLLTETPKLGQGRELPRLIKHKQQLHLGYIALRNNDVKKAIEHYAEIKSTRTPNTKFFQIQLLAAQKKYKAANRQMQRLLARMSQPSYRTYAALLKAQAGEIKDAIQELRVLSRENNTYIWPRLALPALLARQKKNSTALLVFKKTSTIEPDLLKHQRKPTDFYFLPQEWMKLRRYLLRAKAGREERAIFKAAAGLVSYHLGRSGEALSSLRSARNIDRNGMMSNLYLGQIYYERGRYSRASSYAKRVYANYEDNPTAALILANIARKRKKYALALKLYENVQRERPWFLSAKLGAALILIAKDRKKEAKAILKKLMLSQHQHHLMAKALYRIKW